MNDKKKFEPRRFRIYKLSTFDALTDEERSYHMLYKEAKKEKFQQRKHEINVQLLIKVLEKLIETDYTYMIMMIKVR